MLISIIVAMDKNRVIGKDNDLPWRLSADLKHFKKITMGKPIIMGRKTYDSIGKPLPGRENIILTRDASFTAEGCTVMHSLNEIFEYCSAHEEIMIMGGATLYAVTLEQADKLYITQVHAEVEGDTWFPDFDITAWHETDRLDFNADDKNDYDYSFIVLERN